MAVYVGSNRATLVHGDYHPAAMYKGSTRIAGWDESTKPLPATWENTYNDTAQVTLSGASTQTGTPTLDAPIAIQPINGVTITAGGQTIQRSEVLRGMGDTRDTLDVTGGILTRKRGIKIFDGTETPGGFSERTNTVRVQYTITGKAANGTSNVRILCSHGCSTPDQYWSLDEEGICELKNDNFAQIIISVAKTRLSEVSANGVKAWLAAQYAAGTPITVEYDLATPTTEAVASNATNSVQGGTTVGAGSNLAVCDFASIPSWRWSMQTNNVGMHVVYIAAANLPNYGYQPIKLLANGLCSHFPWRKGQEDFWNRAETCITGGTGSSAGFSITQNFAATIDEWIAWMASEKAAGRPLTIAYEVDGWASMVTVDGTAGIKILGN